MKGERQLWQLLQDKLEMLRASNQLPEALRVSEKALGLACKVFSGNHPSLAHSYEQLGLIYDDLEKDTEAAAYLAKALQIREEIEPVDQASVYRMARRLAYLCDMRGDSTEAIAYYQKALSAADQIDIPHSEQGVLLNNIGRIHRRDGRAEAAEPYYLQALELYERQVGPDHLDVAAVLNNLGVFYTNAGRYEEAERAHQRALAIRRRSSNGASDVAQSNCNLAVLYHSQGDLTRASELYRESLRQWEKLERPPEDYEIVASNYADLLRSLGKNRRAGAVESRARKRRL